MQKGTSGAIEYHLEETGVGSSKEGGDHRYEKITTWAFLLGGVLVKR